MLVLLRIESFSYIFREEMTMPVEAYVMEPRPCNWTLCRFVLGGVLGP